MLLTAHADEEGPHLDALRRARDAGFQFTALMEQHSTTVAALYAERWSQYGVVEHITVHGMEEAVAARIRVEDYPCGVPVWERTGTVVEVVFALLALPRHGSTGTTTAQRVSSSLWTTSGSR